MWKLSLFVIVYYSFYGVESTDATAFVLLVIFSRILSGLMVYVSGFTFTKTGRSPQYLAQFAAVPLLSVAAYFVPV